MKIGSPNFVLSNSLTLDSLKELYVSGSLTLNSGVALNINDGTFNIDYGTLTNNGTINLNLGGTMKQTDNSVIIGSSGFNWNEGGTIMTGDYYTMNSPITIPSGRILKIEIALDIPDGQTLTNNGILKGSGTIIQNGTFINSSTGIIAPGSSPRAIDFARPMDIGNGTYNCEINGIKQSTSYAPNSNDSYDFLSTTDNVTLTNAKLVVDWGNFVPELGNTFTVLEYASRVGTFAKITIPYVPGLSFTRTYSSNALIITAVAKVPVQWSGGTGGNWNDPANWTGGVVPSETDSVVFPTSATAFAVVISSAITVGSLNLGNNCTLTLSGGNNLTVNSTFTIDPGATFNLGSSTVNLTGNWSNFGTFNAGTGKLILNGVTQQTMHGSTFSVLEINNPAGVLMLTDENVNDTLILTSGTLTLGTNNLNLGPNATISGASSTNFIVTNDTGKVYRAIAAGSSFLFPVGITATSYNPLTISLKTDDPTETFGVRVEALTNTSSGFSSISDTSTTVKLVWNIYEGTSGGNNANLTFQWNSSENGNSIGLSPSLVSLNHFNSVSNSYNFLGDKSVTTPGSNPIVVTTSGYSFTSFSPFLIGQSGGALPVELVSFTGMVTENKVKLEWQTATEVNNYGFNVERSQESGDGNKEWTKVGFVAGAGNSNSPKNYSYTEAPEGGSKFDYRLKQIDIDGAFVYSDIVSIKLIMPDKFELAQNYPNPFNPSTNIKFSLPVAGDYSLKIYNILGQEVTTLFAGKLEVGNYNFSFDASHLASGIYIYNLRGNNVNIVKKMILMK